MTAQELVLSNALVKEVFRAWVVRHMPAWGSDEKFAELCSKKISRTAWSAFSRSVYATKLQEDHRIDVRVCSVEEEGARAKVLPAVGPVLKPVVIPAEPTNVVPPNPLIALIADGLRDLGYVPAQAVSAEECRRIAESAAREVAELVLGQLKSEGVGTSRQVVEIREAGEVREVVGRAPVWFGRLRKLAACRVPALLVGPPGSGKTTGFKMLAESMGLPFHRVSIAAGTDEGALVGHLIPQKNMNFEYVYSQVSHAFEAPEGGVVLLDDIDLGDANMLGIANAVLDKAGWHIHLRTEKPEFTRSANFYIGAAANTWGHGGGSRYSGANQLDERTLSRLRIGQIYCDYDESLERDLYEKSCVEYGQMIRARIKAIPGTMRYVSTRDIESAHTLLAKFSLQEAWYGFFADWSPAELRHVHAVIDHGAYRVELE